MKTLRKRSLIRRSAFLLALVALTTLLSFLTSTTADAATAVWSRGTGAPLGVVQTPQPRDVSRVVMNEAGYAAQIAPLPGNTISYDQSTDGGVASGVQRTKEIPADQFVVETGYSQGAVVAGDIATEVVEQGIRPADSIRVDVDSDPRMRGTGFEVVMQPYGPFLAPMGATMGGEREDVGVSYYGDCTRYDMVCNMEDPLRNPLGAIASVKGYLDGYHGMYGPNDVPDRVACYEENYCVGINEARNPLATGAEQIIGGPITPQAEDFIKAIAPSTDPGSRDLASPDMAEVVTAGINMVGAAMGQPNIVPELSTPDLGTNMGNGGNPIMEQAALIIDQFVTQAPEPVQQIVEQVQQYIAPPVQSAPEPAYSAPVEQWTAPAPVQEWVNSGIQQLESFANSVQTPAVGNAAPAAPVVPQMPDLGAMAASFFGGV